MSGNAYSCTTVSRLLFVSTTGIRPPGVFFARLPLGRHEPNEIITIPL
jgi:hypothetical protein